MSSVTFLHIGRQFSETMLQNRGRKNSSGFGYDAALVSVVLY